MFWHMYKYRLKVLLGNKYLLFWQGLFPIILGTFFNMAFSGITEMTETLDTINVVVASEEGAVENTEEMINEDEGLSTFLDEMVEREYFKLTYADYDEAVELLSDEQADGILIVSADDTQLGEDFTIEGSGMEISLVFKSNGMKQTILKNIINTYNHGAIVIADAIANNPENIDGVIEELYSEEDWNKDLSISAKNMDTYNQYFFALFAMTCMFGACYGLLNTEHCQADQSTVAIRRASSPTKKMMMVLSEYLAAVTILELLFAVLVVYLVVVLGVDLGDKYGLIAFASFIASLLGVALGYFFGVVLKCKQSAKESVQMSIIMFLNFLAGLMMGNMKYVIEKSCPIVNRINPAAIISDCFYAICAYDDMTLYIRCIISMLVWTVLLAIVSITVLRREKYANL